MSEAGYSETSETPILDSGALPPRMRRKITLGTGVGFVCGVLFGFNMVKIGEEASGSPNAAIGILLFIVALSVAVLIHELGHLTAGLLLGFRFSRISVGPFAVHLEHGRMRISFLRELTALGYTGMHADTVIRLRHRFLVYAIAGPAANLITVPFAALFANHTWFAATHPSSLSFTAQLSMISILLSAVSLLPLPMGATTFTDGFRIATLLKGSRRTRRLLSICAVGVQQQNGTRPKYWRQTWLKAASSVPDDTIDDFWGNCLAYISASARNDQQLASLRLERCLMVSRLLTHSLRDLAAQEAAIFSAWVRRDPLVAEKWLAQIKRRKLMQPLTKCRMEIALHSAHADFREALAAWEEGLACIKILPETPVKQTLLEGWLEWRKQIQERQSHSASVATQT